MPTIVLLVGMPLPAQAQDNAEVERINRVKAAFILNIARFVSWPAQAFGAYPDELALCLYRNNPLSRVIQALHGKKVGGRRLEVVYISRPADLDTCQILLLGPAALDDVAAQLRRDPPRPLLTITDVSTNHTPKTRHNHIMVSLIRSGTHIGFEINLRRVREAGLRMSSRLLKLARIVDDRD